MGTQSPTSPASPSGIRELPSALKSKIALRTYAIGKTGTGKSTLLETLISQHVQRGNGVALLDQHGDLVEKIRGRIPDDRIEDVVHLDAADPFCFGRLATTA